MEKAGREDGAGFPGGAFRVELAAEGTLRVEADVK